MLQIKEIIRNTPTNSKTDHNDEVNNDDKINNDDGDLDYVGYQTPNHQ